MSQSDLADYFLIHSVIIQFSGFSLGWANKKINI